MINRLKYGFRTLQKIDAAEAAEGFAFTLRMLGILLILLYISGCIEPYNAELEESYNMLSVEGSLVKGEEIQTVVLSRSTSLQELEYIEMTGCLVSVMDELGNQFLYNEKEVGTYEASIPDDQLVCGRNYKLQVITPRGDLYESSYETLMSGAEVDTVYYQVESFYYNILRKERKQYSLDEGAFNYWDKAKNETQEGGGLYTQQPGVPITNLHNVNDESEMVLGYFWVSSQTEQRIFVSCIDSLETFDPICVLEEYDPRFHDQGPFPRYIFLDYAREKIYTGSNYCFNCTLRGGSTTPPDFWE